MVSGFSISLQPASSTSLSKDVLTRRPTLLELTSGEAIAEVCHYLQSPQATEGVANLLNRGIHMSTTVKQQPHDVSSFVLCCQRNRCLLEMLLAPRRSLGLALLLYSFVEDTFTQERGSKKGYLLFFLYFSSCFDILVQYT